jgi:predicted permease
MSNLLQDVRYAVRLLKRAPGFSAVAILVLALGIGANVGVFSVVNTLILQPRPGRIDSLVGLFNRDRDNASEYRRFSYPAFVELRDRGDIFDSVLAQTFTTIGVKDGDLTKQAFGALVSANFFSTAAVPLAAGRSFTLDEERGRAPVRVAMASYGVWKTHHLDPGFVGSTVRLNGSDFTVVGVAPRGFGGVMAFVSPQWWLPLGAYDSSVNETFKDSARALAARDNYALTLVAALKPGVTRAAADTALDAFAKQLGDAYPASDGRRTFFLAGVPRLTVSTRPQGDGPIAALAGLLMLMSLLVLAIACLNLANLLLARGVARRREIAIRQALGSGRRRIVQQLLVEGLLLSAIGAAGGLLAGWWTTIALSAWLASIITFGIDLVVEPSSRLVMAAGSCAVLSTLFFALGPAWSLSRPEVTGDLKGEPGRVTRRMGVGPILVIGQLAASLALVAAGGLFTRGAVNAATVDAGFPMAHQLVVNVDPSLAGYNESRTRETYRAILDRLRSLPGVERASLASTVAFGDIQLGGRVRTSPTDAGIDATFDAIGADYFDTLGVPILRGREFTRAEEQPAIDRAGAVPAIINARLAKQLFHDADPIGRELLVQPGPGQMLRYTVVGVVPGLRHDLFEEAPRPHVYAPSGSRYTPLMTLHVRTAAGAPDAAMLGTIRRELQSVDSQLPIISAKTMAGLRDTSLSVWTVRAAATLFTAFGVLALLLAAIGVYGLKAYDVSRRTREIGIRMALGATSGDVVRLVVGEGGRTTAIGLTLGVLAAMAIGKLASGFLFRVSPFDPIVLTVAASVLTAAAMLASYVPARRATRVVPLDALRSE